MPPKRKKAAAKKPAPKKARASEAEAEASPKTEVEQPSASPKKQPKAAKAATPKKLSVTEVWADEEVVSNGVMTQVGFGKMCSLLEIEELSFEAVYLLYTLVPTIDEDDVMTVCRSARSLRDGMQKLGAREITDLPRTLRNVRSRLEEDYDMYSFQPFFKWIFDLSKGISALNSGANASAVRSVPIGIGMQMMDAALGSWAFMPKFKAFCAREGEAKASSFTKDVWVQIGRFVHLTKNGFIVSDLSNYDDDDTGGCSAWPCMIDEFVEFVQAEDGAY